MTLSPDDLTRLWRTTLGDDGAAQGWPTLSGGATYRGAGEGTTPLVQATLSGGQTVGGGTLSGGATVGGAGSGGSTGVSTSKLGLAGFQLQEEIGRGGMGVVWRARQESLARDIAVKLIRPEAANERTRQGFVAEALVNGVLDHPNIVPVHEMGTAPGGEVFLAMKLVGGTSWDRLLHPRDEADKARAATYDRDKHLGVLDAVANAVAFAHSKGIVHRDLKPENVMVGAYGEVLVMDWGIAVDIRTKPDPSDSRAVHKSAIRSPAGTPNYMAPELAEGRGDDIGPWTDVYLLGGILHEILTGRPPHRGNSLMALLLAASTSAAPAFDAQVPAGLADICRRALSRDHRARYQDVPAFQAALAEYRKHRESENIATAAETALRRTAGREAAKLGGAERSALYGDFAEAVAGYRQALALWAGNEAAKRGERDARLAYASAARAAGDLGLAEAQAAALPTGDQEADTLRSAIATDRAAADRAARAARRNRGLLMGAAGLIVAGSVAGFLLVEQERARTVEQRDKAVAAEQDAARQRDAAVAAEGKAVEQERRARTALASTLIDQGISQAGQGLNLAALDPLWRAIETAPADDATSTLRADAWRLWRLVAAGAMGSAGELKLTPPPAIDAAEMPVRLLDAVPGPGGKVASLWHVGERQTVPGKDDAYTTVMVLRIEQPGTATPPRDRELLGVSNPEGLLWLDGALVVGVTWEPHLFGHQQLVGLDPTDLSERWALPGAYGRPYGVDATSFVVEFRYGWLRCSAVDGRVLSRTITRQFDGETDQDIRPTWWSPTARWVAMGETAGNNRFPHLLRIYHEAASERYLSPLERMTERPVVPDDPHVRLVPPSPDELLREVVPSGDGGRLAVVTQGANINRLLLYGSSDGGLVQILDDQLPASARIAAVTPAGDAVWVTVPDGRNLLYASGTSALTKRQIVASQDDVATIRLSSDGTRMVRLLKQGTIRFEQVDDGKLLREHQVPAGHRFSDTTLDGTALVFIGVDGIQLTDVADGRALGRIAIPPTVPGGDYDANPFVYDTGSEPDPAAPGEPGKTPRPTSEEPATPAQIADYLAMTGVVVALAEDRRSALVYSEHGYPWGRFSLPDGKGLEGGVDLPRGFDANFGRRSISFSQVGTAVLIEDDHMAPNGGHDHSGFITRDAGATAINLSDDFGTAVGALRAPIAISGGTKGASVWDLRTGRLLRHLGSGAGRALAIDPDGRLAATLAGGTIIVWDVASGRRLTQLPAPEVELVWDWRMTEGGRALRWVEDGVREFALVDERAMPTQQPVVIPPVATVARTWPQHATRPVGLRALTARLHGAREAGAPLSGLRRTAALGLAAIPPTVRLTVEDREGFVAEIATWPAPPALVDGAPPPVPEVLGFHEPQQVDGSWQISLGSGTVWRYVPPGEYRFDQEKTVVRLSTGFWAMTAPLSVKQYQELEYPAKGVLEACLPGELPADRDGLVDLSLGRALLLTDPLLPVRLPGSAEAIAMMQRFGPLRNTWLSDRWMGGQGRQALDPWGAWDRIALGAAAPDGLPVLDAVPGSSAQGAGVTALLSYDYQGSRRINFEGSLTASWSVVLVAPAW